MAGFLPFDEADLNTLYSKVWYILNMMAFCIKVSSFPQPNIAGHSTIYLYDNRQILEGTMLAIQMTIQFLKPTMSLLNL